MQLWLELSLFSYFFQVNPEIRLHNNHKYVSSAEIYASYTQF
jgi:hypothetical protein